MFTGVQPPPVALYAVPPNVSDEYRQALGALIDDSKQPRWVWMAGEVPMPALPDHIGYEAAWCTELPKGCAEAAVQS